MLAGCHEGPQASTPSSEVALPASASVAASPAPPPEPSPPGPEPSPPGPEPSPPASVTFDRELTIRCFTAAIEALAWLPAGAHTSAFMKTALETRRLPAECGPLAGDDHPRGYPIDGGGTLHWSRENERVRGDRVFVTIAFYCNDDACPRSDDIEIELPASWHCTSWVHGPHHGTACYRSASACERGRASIAPGRDTIPCARHQGAAYCAPSGDCYPDPWACSRESGGSIEKGTCARTDG